MSLLLDLGKMLVKRRLKEGLKKAAAEKQTHAVANILERNGGVIPKRTAAALRRRHHSRARTTTTPTAPRTTHQNPVVSPSSTAAQAIRQLETDQAKALDAVDSSIRTQGGNLTGAVTDLGDQVSSAIDRLNDALGGLLGKSRAQSVTPVPREIETAPEGEKKESAGARWLRRRKTGRRIRRKGGEDEKPKGDETERVSPKDEVDGESWLKKGLRRGIDGFGEGEAIGAGAGVLGGAEAGAEVGMFGGPVGALVGGAIGAGILWAGESIISSIMGDPEEGKQRALAAEARKKKVARSGRDPSPQPTDGDYGTITFDARSISFLGPFNIPVAQQPVTQSQQSDQGGPDQVPGQTPGQTESPTEPTPDRPSTAPATYVPSTTSPVPPPADGPRAADAAAPSVQVASLDPRSAPGAVQPGSALSVARSKIGMSETGDNYNLKRFLSTGKGWNNLNPAQTAWCAAFVNASLAKAGEKGTGRLNAKSFLNWGRGVDIDHIRPGDVGVMNRGGKRSPQLDRAYQGHVGFVDSVFEKNGVKYVRLLGGNQGNRVSERTYRADQFLAFRRDEERTQMAQMDQAPAPPAKPEPVREEHRQMPHPEHHEVDRRPGRRRRTNTLSMALGLAEEIRRGADFSDYLGIINGEL